ncbi:hypothetical protein [Sphingomonas folli]|uniref:hypothetical protein n=1 Tax=Sphingomonas folli TaxID=2862497 RepID=UPI002156122C|nr:hypothetical protein [Sphingomonas folli]
MAGITVLVAVLVVALGWSLVHRTGPVVQRPVRGRSPAVTGNAATEPARRAPELAIGQTLEWTSGGMPGETVRQVGPIRLRVRRRVEDDAVAPVVEVSLGRDAVTIVGELASEGFTHRISAIRNSAGGSPVVMLQSFSGGAHCCNHIQVAGLSSGRLKVVDLGSSDGEAMPLPYDMSGDGVADFVGVDEAFLYAFAPYAMSFAPPVVRNVTGGRVIDVSRNGAFRRLFREEMKRAGETCRSGGDGVDRNGACPSYVASAARIGQLEPAWAEMMRSYAADAEWVLPTGCTVRSKAECPEAARIVYKSYPEALLAFLKERGYVPAGWSPPQVLQDGPIGGSDEATVWSYVPGPVTRSSGGRMRARAS